MVYIWPTSCSGEAMHKAERGLVDRGGVVGRPPAGRTALGGVLAARQRNLHSSLHSSHLDSGCSTCQLFLPMRTNGSKKDSEEGASSEVVGSGSNFYVLRK